MAHEKSHDYQLCKASSFFDPAWYLQTYRDVADLGADPVDHYLKSGAAEGRNPGPSFSTLAYLSYRSDVAAAGLNPLVHFLRVGILELAALPVAQMPREAERLGLSFGEGGRFERARTGSYSPKTGPVAVFVSHDASVTGAPAVLASVARWFQRHTDYDVRIVCLEGGRRLEEFSRIAPTLVLGNPDIDGGQLERTRATLMEFIGTSPAFTFINSIAAGGYCRLDPYDAPRIAFVHELAQVINVMSHGEQLIRDRADHVICDGDAVAALLSERGFRSDQLSIRTSFVDLVGAPAAMSAEDKAAVRASFGWPRATKIVMACGTVHWRKQPGTFVRMAAAIKGDVRFVWIGGGDDLDAMRDLARSTGVDDRVEFLGPRDDFRQLMRAADVFALTSSEDPFPLVCLEAALAFAPSVIFREAGGMAKMVEPEGEEPAGRAVPLGDEAAFFAAVQGLLDDDVAREGLGRVARNRVAELYTIDPACLDILQTVRRAAALPPRVSVVVPVYNSAAYLQDRLKSIGEQTFRDVEIILRDDASQDGSLPMLEAFAASHPLARVVRAAENSGSVFNAWAACLELAKGELVWIAEADDLCANDFLERMVPAFATSGVRLAHGRSVPVNARGDVVGDYATAYLDSISPGRWRESFVTSASAEVSAALGRGNCIPNASAVVVRRGSARRAVAIAAEFQLAGDWAFYLTALHGGRIAYVHEAVNYHRRHDATVTHRIEGSKLYFEELANANALARQFYGPDEARDSAFGERLQQEAARFGWTEPLLAARLSARASRQRPPGVLYGVGDLSGGGAQMFAARFVNGWLDTGAPTVLFTTGYQPDHDAVRSVISPEVPVLTASEIGVRGLRAVMKEYGLDVVVTGHWWGDRWAGDAIDRLDPAARPPWAIIMHGCHENVLDQPEAFADRLKVFRQAEQHAGLWMWTADKNRRLFEQGKVKPRATASVVTGFTAIEPRPMSRASLGVPDDALLFMIASRAIASKGWDVAVAALAQVRASAPNGRRAHLLMVGDGPVATEIDKRPLPDGIHRVPHTGRLADYIAASDVGLLPSWFPGESMPLVLIEFLAQGKPAIASDIGKCRWLLSSADGTETAGIIVERGSDGRVGVEVLADAMTAFLRDDGLAGRLGATARDAFGKFEFGAMIDAYAENLSRLEQDSHHV